ncbi:hypothetical protein F5Y16DRAFT_7830 [Xylariaceae sp. FL0255]|nr:hypothetical protein F5Y16DRAFT_7830 [Xylariaceae sp. FL0255]
MQFSVPVTVALAAVVPANAANANINAQGVKSQTPYSCNAVGGIGLTFDADFGYMRTSFPNLALAPDVPDHEEPVYDSIMFCQTTVQFVESDFGSGTYQYRFAITNVTWSNNNLTLPSGANFDTLMTQVDLSIEVDNSTSPPHYPIGIDLYAGNLVNLNSNPGVAVNDSFSGPFSYTAKVPNPVFTPCFLGRDYHTLNFAFNILAQTVDGGVSSAGWNLDFGLDYEACNWTPASDDWGSTQIRGYEEITYNTKNQTVAKRGLPKTAPHGRHH